MYGHVRTRRQRILSGLSFAGLGLFVAGGTIVLVLLAKGYNFDFSTREVIQNGLVLIASEPVSAEVFIDGETVEDNTPHRVTIPAGEHEVLLKRPGYRDWRRDFDLAPGEVLWLSYPLLLPDALQTRELSRPSGPLVAEASPDSSRLAAAGGLIMHVFSSDRTEAAPLVIDLTAAVPGLTGTIESLIWSNDNVHFIARVKTGGTPRLVLVTLRDDEAGVAELSAELTHYSDLQFVPERIDQLYGLRDGALWQINLGDGSPLQQISERADRYAIFESALLSWSAAGQRVILHQGQRHSVLDTPPVTNLSNLSLSSHDRRLVATFSSPTLGTIIIVEPATAGQQVITHPRSGDQLVFSPGANYMASHTANHFQVYDFERRRFYTYDLPVSEVSNLRWATGSQLVAITDDQQASLFDFDGSNLQPLAGGLKGAIILSPNREHLLNLARSSVDGEVILTDTQLVPTD